MTWFKSKMTQKALYYEPPKMDGLGNYTWNYPDELDVRWDFNSRKTMYNASGAQITSNTSILVFNRYLLLGAYIMRGDLYSKQNLLNPSIQEPYDVEHGTVESQEYARLIIKIDNIESVYNDNMNLARIWLR